MAGQNSIATLVARLFADSTGFTAGLAEAEASLATFEGRVRAGAVGAQRAMQSMTGAVNGVTGAFAGATRWLVPLGVSLSFLSAVNNARTFEQQINTIAAISRGSAADMARLEAAIRGVGLATGAGAEETAHAADELIRVTGSFDDTIGSLHAVVQLARATGEGVESAAAVALHAMRDFGLSAGDMERVVNGAAGVIKHSMITTLEDYANTLGAAGGATHTLGVSLEDFNAVVGVISSNFASGQAAATAFKTVLIRLVAPSAAAQRVMNDLHLSIFDANGDLVDMVTFTRHLQTALTGLTTQQRDHVLAILAGNRGITALAALYREGADALAHYRDVTLADSNVNAIATRRWQGVQGAIADLSAQWQNLSITLGESGLDQFLAGSIEWVSQFVSGLERAGELLAGLASPANTTGPVSALTHRLTAEQAELDRMQATLSRANSRFAGAPDSTAISGGMFGGLGAITVGEARQNLEARIARLQSNVEALRRAIAQATPLPEVNATLDIYSAAERRRHNEALARSLAVAGNGELDAEGLRQALSGTQQLTDAERAARDAQRDFQQAMTSTETPFEHFIAQVHDMLDLQQRMPDQANAISGLMGRMTENFIEAQAGAHGFSDELAQWQRGDAALFQQIANTLATDIGRIAQGGPQAANAIAAINGTINTLMIALGDVHDRAQSFADIDKLRDDLSSAGERAHAVAAQQVATLQAAINAHLPGLTPQDIDLIRRRINASMYQALASDDGVEGAAVRFTQDVQGSIRDAWINGDWSNVGDAIKHSWRAMLWDALIGSTADGWMMQLAQALKTMLARVLGTASGKGGGSTGKGLLDAIGSEVSSIFGGHFADGGFLPPGKWGVAGEYGPEPIFGGATGLTVVPHGEGGGSGVTQIFKIDARGSTPGVEARIRAAVAEATVRGAQGGAALVFKRLKAGQTL